MLPPTIFQVTVYVIAGNLLGEGEKRSLWLHIWKSITNTITCFPAVEVPQSCIQNKLFLTGGSPTIQQSPPSPPPSTCQTKSRKLLLLPPPRHLYRGGIWNDRESCKRGVSFAPFHCYCLIWNFPYCHPFLPQSAQEGGEGRSRIKAIDFSLWLPKSAGIFQRLWGWAVDVVSYGMDELLCFTSLHARSPTRPGISLRGWEWHHHSKCSGFLNLRPKGQHFHA